MHAFSTWEKSVELFDFEHKIDLKKGLTKMWEWAKEQPHHERLIWEKYEIEKGIYSYWKKN
jgi:UDP-glucose 4-epimerase